VPGLVAHLQHGDRSERGQRQEDGEDTCCQHAATVITCLLRCKPLVCTSPSLWPCSPVV
jgi:hypothetical protein